jgi:hypothetical protein
MTREDIIRMAREVWSAGDVYIGPSTESLERFAALDAALAEPDAKREPVAWLIWLYGPQAAYLNKQEAELEFASRSRDYPHPDRKIVPLYLAPPKPDAKREPATDEQVAEADESHEPSWLDYRDGWRDAERFHGIRKEDK